jgi:hypothetical protein
MIGTRCHFLDHSIFGWYICGLGVCGVYGFAELAEFIKRIKVERSLINNINHN